MKKYSVKIHYTTYIYDEVEANSPEEAVEKAKNNIDEMDDINYQETLVGNISYDEAEVIDQDDKGYNPIFL